MKIISLRSGPFSQPTLRNNRPTSAAGALITLSLMNSLGVSILIDSLPYISL